MGRGTRGAGRKEAVGGKLLGYWARFWDFLQAISKWDSARYGKKWSLFHVEHFHFGFGFELFHVEQIAVARKSYGL
jgi:hypothetical protein